MTLNTVALANDAKRALSKLEWMAQDSLAKTLACKYQTTKAKVWQKYRDGQASGLAVTYKIKGQHKVLHFFLLKDLKTQDHPLDSLPSGFEHERSQLLTRLNAGACEYCDNKQGPFEVHHVQKLKDLKGKTYWERLMITMNRKTLILCVNCHRQLHKGTLASNTRTVA